MIFDTHAHYDDKAFDEDRNELLLSLKSNNINYVVDVASNYPSNSAVLNLCDKYDFFYGALGIHPSDCGDLNFTHFSEIENNLSNPKVVAVGEIGLDYHYDTPEKDIQKKWFTHQLNMAKKHHLPVIIHSRDAAQDTYDIMVSEKARDIGGVVHCYSYSVEMAKNYLNMGFYIGIGGVVTFKNAQKLKDVVAFTPLNRLVTETDCPYLSPEPNRGKRNTSLNIPFVIKKIAEIKNLPEDEVESTLYDNALTLYNMKGL